jgi:hypothetical protein
MVSRKKKIRILEEYDVEIREDTIFSFKKGVLSIYN